MSRVDPSQSPSAPASEGDQPREPGRTFAELVAWRMSRRELLAGMSAAALAACGGAPRRGGPSTTPGADAAPESPEPPRSAAAPGPAGAPGAANPSTLRFAPVPKGADPQLHVAEGHRARVLLRWGDPLHRDSPAWRPGAPVAADQERQFGTNNDFIGYHPLPFVSAASAQLGRSDHGLLSVNHEYPSTRFMWGDLEQGEITAKMTRARVEAELAAIGHTVVEVQRVGGEWQVVRGSRYNRRFSARSTVFEVTGPAAGHRRLKTRADPTGRRVLGTMHNCSGGVTPWGTTLSGEENFHKHFRGEALVSSERRNHARYGLKGQPEWPWWGLRLPRFDVEKEPREPNRHGWVLELDPYDPTSAPKKRTALGRINHEGATSVVTRGGRVAVYMGDDRRGEYIYRFVTKGAFDPKRPRANRDLLDQGTLYVAQFRGDGTLRWLPLVFGVGPLGPGQGFHSQADVLIETRRAADLVGATPMDRPEDVETNPVTGVVFAMLTNNSRRKQADGPNPRAPNLYGSVLAMVPPGGQGAAADHTAEIYTWTLPMLGGDPGNKAHGARYHPMTTDGGWFASPDNCTFDRKGRLWLTSDQGANYVRTGLADGVYGCDTTGPGAWLPRRLLRSPIGAECTGPCMTPDNTTLFVSVQHPGVDVEGSTWSNPASRWPDFKPGVPPRASVVAVQRDDGGVIGG